MVTNYDLRQRASKVIRPNLQVLLLIALIAALPGLLINVVIARTGSDATAYLFSHGVDTASTADQIIEVMAQFSRERGWVAPLLSLVNLLITPVLTLGFLNATLTLLRGGTAVVGDAFSRMRVMLRATLLTLWVAIKIVLWGMPGMALVVLSLFVGEAGFVILNLAGFILILALTAMAYYRYSLATVFQADEPELGVLTCVRKSKAVMKGRKMQLFMLTLSYNLWRVLAITLGVELLGYVIGNLVSLTVQLVLSVYINGAYCVFYEAYARPAGGRAHAFQSDPYHNEMQE